MHLPSGLKATQVVVNWLSCRESASRPGHGVLTLRHRVVNQDGVEVMTYKTTRLMELRPA